MPVVTTTVSKVQYDTAWSYSRLHDYEICPRRCSETKLQKNKWPEAPSEAMQWGSAVHEAIAIALKKGIALEEPFKDYQSWVDKVNRASVRGKLYVEDDARYAITRQFKPVLWFSPKVWLRCIGDAVVIKEGNKVAWVIDWKTGKSGNVDTLQLTLTSLVMFCQFPDLQLVQSDFIWLSDDASTSSLMYRDEAADEWAKILPRVNRFQLAAANNDFPPKQNYFCKKHCPVRSCEYYGK